jgi:hypothetical protein
MADADWPKLAPPSSFLLIDEIPPWIGLGGVRKLRFAEVKIHYCCNNASHSTYEHKYPVPLLQCPTSQLTAAAGCRVTWKIAWRALNDFDLRVVHK